MSKYSIIVIVIAIIMFCVKCSNSYDYTQYDCDLAHLGGIEYLEECAD